MTTRSGGKINISEDSKLKLKELKTTDQLIKDYTDYNRDLEKDIIEDKNQFIDTVIPNSEKYEKEIKIKKEHQKKRKEYLLREINKLAKKDLTEMDKYYLSESDNDELEKKYRLLKESKKNWFRRIVELFI